MPSDGRTVGATDTAVPLASVARDVDDDVAARVAGIVTGVTAVQPVHAAGGEMQRRAHADHGGQDVGKSLILVTIVEVPALA
jgi:hypothetical protein